MRLVKVGWFAGRLGGNDWVDRNRVCCPGLGSWELVLGRGAAATCFSPILGKRRRIHRWFRGALPGFGLVDKPICEKVRSWLIDRHGGTYLSPQRLKYPHGE
jgi:hypothetical protein